VVFETEYIMRCSSAEWIARNGCALRWCHRGVGRLNWGNCGIRWVNCAVLSVWKTAGKDTSDACVIACQTAQFTQFFLPVWRQTLKSLSWPEFNKKTKGTTSMELFTVTGKLIYLTIGDVRCVHHWWHGTHRYDIQVLATHARQHECIDILHCCNDPCL